MRAEGLLGWVDGGPRVRVCPFLSPSSRVVREQREGVPTHHLPAGPRAGSGRGYRCPCSWGGCPGASGCPQTAGPSAAHLWPVLWAGPGVRPQGAPPSSPDLGHHDLTRASSLEPALGQPPPSVGLGNKGVLSVHPPGHHSSTSCPVIGLGPASRASLPRCFLSGGERTLPSGPDLRLSSQHEGATLGWEDPLEEGRATYPRILAWRIPMDRKAWQAIVHGVTKVQTKRLSTAQHSTEPINNVIVSGGQQRDSAIHIHVRRNFLRRNQPHPNVGSSPAHLLPAPMHLRHRLRLCSYSTWGF